MTTGEKIQYLRKKERITQEELAVRLDVTRQAVSRWESDQSVPETDNLVKMSEIFDVSIDYLVKYNEISLSQKQERHRLQYFNTAVFILIVLSVLSAVSAVAVSYIIHQPLWGLMICSLFITFQVIAYAVVRNKFIVLSEFNDSDKKTVALNTSKIYTSIITSFFVVLFLFLEVKENIDVIVGNVSVYSMVELLPWGVMLSLLFAAAGFILSKGIVEQIHFKIVLKKEYIIRPFFIFLDVAVSIIMFFIIINAVMADTYDIETTFACFILIIVIYSLIIPVILKIKKLINVKQLMFNILTLLTAALLGIMFLLRISGIWLLIPVAAAGCVQLIFSQFQENEPLPKWNIKNSIVLSLSTSLILIDTLELFVILTGVMIFLLLSLDYLVFAKSVLANVFNRTKTKTEEN